ncbi:helix-turn-helix domain-containing protein [Nocardia sp. NPDC052254]|uniref:MarR family winged helix-turn-helix transcriptional regulator n=1 Tax=Nocardia sp. NPDC052254 TaxID=3155681 RepID=UPI003445AAB0
MSGANATRNTSAAVGDLARVLRDLAWTVHRLVPEVAGLDPLPTTELAVLMQVLTTPGSTVTDMARRLGMRHSNVSAAVRDLVARGLVTREPSAADRRVSLLMPTDKAYSEQDSIDSVWSGTVRAAMVRLDPAQVQAIEGAADALAALDHVLRDDRNPRRRN